VAGLPAYLCGGVINFNNNKRMILLPMERRMYGLDLPIKNLTGRDMSICFSKDLMDTALII